ncbi:MAG: hypothetical protein CFE26_16995, partial [Verrucomicrobiales bacterium VVV1]
TRTEDNGSTLIWDYTLEEALKKPLTTRVKAQIPLPWWVFASAAGIVLAIAALIVRVVKKRRPASSPLPS